MAKTEVGTSGTGAVKTGIAENVRRKVVWVLLVMVVPFIALLVMIGIALQVMGVPVWGTTVHWLSQSRGQSSAIQGVQQQLAAAQAKVQSLQSENQSLNQQISAEKQKEQVLSSNLAQLQQGAVQANSTLGLAKQEAAVLKTMNPQAAGLVLSKMTTKEAAAAIAVMPPATAGPILNTMNPTQVGQLLALAAQLGTQANVTHAGNATANTVG